MATLSHYIPNAKSNIICCKGGEHQQQPLNLICLDPLCRTAPLACSVCFSQIHKYHKVVSLNKFIDDYRRNIGSVNTSMLQKKINKHYNILKTRFDKFKQNLIKQIQHFELSIDKYAEYLSGQALIRNCVGHQLNIETEPNKILNMKSQNQLECSLRFILNNSLYDTSLNMINVSQILKQNEDRVCALLDKLVYMTQFCQISIKQSVSLFKFANLTLKDQKNQMINKIDKLMSAHPDPTSLKNYMKEKNQLKKLIQEKGCLVLQQSQKVEHQNLWNEIQKSDPEFLFGKHRFKQLQLSNNGECVKSTIHYQKPQYALGWPDLNSDPNSIKQWFIKIKRCRDFASQNTMAVGISRISDMKLADFKGRPTNCLMISSQGYVTLNQKTQKTKFSFRQGDVIHFRYDPFYQILEATKQNGRKLTLRTLGTHEPVYPCVRFTYASDQVQFV